MHTQRCPHARTSPLHARVVVDGDGRAGEAVAVGGAVGRPVHQLRERLQAAQRTPLVQSCQLRHARRGHGQCVVLGPAPMVSLVNG